MLHLWLRLFYPPFPQRRHFLSLLRTLHTHNNPLSSQMDSTDIKKDQAPPAPEDPEKKKKKDEKVFNLIPQ